jgi:hypothetical protein
MMSMEIKERGKLTMTLLRERKIDGKPRVTRELGMAQLDFLISRRSRSS